MKTGAPRLEEIVKKSEAVGPQHLCVIVSPAKKMTRADNGLPATSAPQFASAARALALRLKAMGVDELRHLWRCSEDLASGAQADLAALDPDRFGEVGALPSPAIMSYVGIQYQSMAPHVMTEDALRWVGGHLRIVSGLFGLLRPFDGVAPYRLEMQARLAMPRRADAPDAPARNLYEFWDETLARAIEREGARAAQGQRTATHVVNLASVEYARAVLPHLSPETPVTTCIFLEPRPEGRLVQQATASKTARGTMVRWMAEEGIEHADDLRAFDLGGYRFNAKLSQGDGPRATLAFVNERD